MTEKENNIIYLLSVIPFIIVSAMLCFTMCHKEPVEPEVVTKSDTIYIESTDTFYVTKEKIRYRDKIVLDTIFITDTVLLREQKCYTDSFSTVYVSGIEPEIDSIFHYIPRDTIRINTTETVTYTKTKHWGQSVVVGVQLGYGVTINQTPTFSPYIGVGITYGFGYNF